MSNKTNKRMETLQEKTGNPKTELDRTQPLKKFSENKQNIQHARTNGIQMRNDLINADLLCN